MQEAKSKFYILTRRTNPAEERIILYEMTAESIVNISVWHPHDATLSKHSRFASPTRYEDAREHWNHCVMVGYTRDRKSEEVFNKEQHSHA